MDPFKPVYIVTQTEGMNVWLKTKLAEQLDITANIIFLNPNDLINRINNRMISQDDMDLNYYRIQANTVIHWFRPSMRQ